MHSKAQHTMHAPCQIMLSRLGFVKLIATCTRREGGDTTTSQLSTACCMMAGGQSGLLLLMIGMECRHQRQEA
jgi:hypothetical protein